MIIASTEEDRKQLLIPLFPAARRTADCAQTGFCCLLTLSLTHTHTHTQWHLWAGCMHTGTAEFKMRNRYQYSVNIWNWSNRQRSPPSPCYLSSDDKTRKISDSVNWLSGWQSFLLLLLPLNWTKNVASLLEHGVHKYFFLTIVTCRYHTMC